MVHYSPHSFFFFFPTWLLGRSLIISLLSSHLHIRFFSISDLRLNLIDWTLKSDMNDPNTKNTKGQVATFVNRIKKDPNPFSHHVWRSVKGPFQRPRHAHCSKSSFFVQKSNFDFPRKLSIFFLVKNSWKCCGFWPF